MVQDDLHPKPQGRTTKVETIHPDGPFRRVLMVHPPHVPVDHAPGDGVILGTRAVVDLRPEGFLRRLLFERLESVDRVLSD